jgi:YidC/Oxa1 family membrane protein insertase
MFGLVFFLGYQLFFGQRAPQGNEGVLSMPELFVRMRENSARMYVDKVPTTFAALNNAIKTEKGAGRITRDQADLKQLEAITLYSDFLMKRGLNDNNLGQIQLAFQTLSPQERFFRNRSEWKSLVFDLAPSEKYPVAKASGSEVYKTITTELDKRYKTDNIWGLFPGYQIIDFLVGLTGKTPGFSYWFAALLLAIVVRAIIWPLAQKQLLWGRQMTQLQPYMKELEEAFKKKDPSGAFKQTPEYQQKVMALYKEYGMNPVAGCLPAMAQLPLFLFVYQCMVHYRFSFEAGTFLWVNPTTAASVTGWIGHNLGEMDVPLIILYGISMVITTMLAPVSDPNMARTSRLIGVGLAVVWTVMMFFFPLPSAFVLYWIFTNIFSSLQSIRAYRMPLAPLTKKSSVTGGVIPESPKNGHVNGSANGLFGKTGAPKSKKK